MDSFSNTEYGLALPHVAVQGCNREAGAIEIYWNLVVEFLKLCQIHSTQYSLKHVLPGYVCIRNDE